MIERSAIDKILDAWEKERATARVELEQMRADMAVLRAAYGEAKERIRELEDNALTCVNCKTELRCARCGHVDGAALEQREDG